MDGKGQVTHDFCSFRYHGAWFGSKFAQSMMPQKEKENLVIAGKLGPESEILMNMYKLLIEENSDMTVTVKLNFGKTDFLYQALKRVISISIQNLQGPLQVLLQPAPKVSNDSKEVFEVARDGIKKQDNLAFTQTDGLSKHLCDCCSKSI